MLALCEASRAGFTADATYGRAAGRALLTIASCGALADDPADERASAVMLTQGSRKALAMCQAKSEIGISSYWSAWPFNYAANMCPSLRRTLLFQSRLTPGAQGASQDDFLLYGNAGGQPRGGQQEEAVLDSGA